MNEGGGDRHGGGGGGEGRFSALLRLEPAGPGRFIAPRGPERGERLFGGQLLAQCLRAAEVTLEGERDAHSLHAYFLRPGDPERPLELAVEAIRDGRTFSSRQVSAAQDGRELFRMLASFQVPEESPEFSASRMPRVREPEEISFTYDDFTLQQTGAEDWYGSARPLDVRYVNPPGVRGEPVTEDQLMWLRITERLPADPGVHRAGVAYLSDATLVDHVMLPHGLRWQDSDFDGASLDHAMWFHRPARADQWLLFVQGVESTGRGRGLTRGRLFDRSGALVATCAQEGLMRWTRPRA